MLGGQHSSLRGRWCPLGRCSRRAWRSNLLIHPRVCSCLLSRAASRAVLTHSLSWMVSCSTSATHVVQKGSGHPLLQRVLESCLADSTRHNVAAGVPWADALIGFGDAACSSTLMFALVSCHARPHAQSSFIVLDGLLIYVSSPCCAKR